MGSSCSGNTIEIYGVDMKLDLEEGLLIFSVIFLLVISFVELFVRWS